jgi:hypothetical protein
MPLDSPTLEEAPVVARQVGGRVLGHDSDLWKTLFPSDVLRIDGRVPTESSSHFLLQMRMNSQKELIACAFSAVEGNSMLQTFSEFFLQKKYVLCFLTCNGNRISDNAFQPSWIGVPVG